MACQCLRRCVNVAPDPTRQDAEQGGSNRYGEAQAAAGESEGVTTAGAEDNTVVTGVGVNGEESERQGTAVHSTHENKGHSTKRGSQPVDRNNVGRRDGGGQA